MVDDGGFFGPNKLFYYWMLKKFKGGVKTEKLKYWMFRNDMKVYHEQHQRKLKEQSVSMQQPKL